MTMSATATAAAVAAEMSMIKSSSDGDLVNYPNFQVPQYLLFSTIS